ncbi:hypothetical protein OG900_05670 [Streptomyces sp. NBC_00433]
MEEVLDQLLFMFRWLLTGGPSRAEQRLAGLREQIDALRRYAGGLEQRLDAADRERALQGEQVELVRATLSRLQDDQHTQHAELAAKWRKLLSDRRIVRLVESAVEHAPDRAWQPADQSEAAHWARVRAEAVLRRTCAELLIAGEDVDRSELERLLVSAGTDGAAERAAVADLAARAAGLHREGSRLKERPEFDFSPPEPVVTPTTGSLYSSECGFGRPALYVVLPAYRAGAMRLTAPTVLTEPAVPATGRDLA